MLFVRPADVLFTVYNGNSLYAAYHYEDFQAELVLLSDKLSQFLPSFFLPPPVYL